jgi:acid phosphatase (class A)
MMNFGQIGSIDSIQYGHPAQKNLDSIDRQRSDTSTALGRYLASWGHGGMPCELISPPPRNSSTKTVNELNLIIQRMSESTQEERDFAQSMDSTRAHYSMWASEATRITGKKYDFEFIRRISESVEGFIDYLKVYYNRPRPYQLAPAYGKRIVRIVPDPRTASYPSGHAFDAYTFACILGNEHPKYAHEFYEIAARIGDSRIVAGVHFPSDIAAGAKAAEWTVDNLLKKDLT